MARLTNQVNKEQLIRLAGEYNALAERDHLHLPAELGTVFETLVQAATERLGMPRQDIAK